MPETTITRIATPVSSSHWTGRVVIVSPHLDDAVLSLGASARAASRRGARVDVLTVLSGDTASTTPADSHNSRAGFRTVGEAARARRLEDELACSMVGARALWLPFADDGNEPPPGDEEISTALADRLKDYDSILVPGFPLRHPDHQRIARLTLGALQGGNLIGLYVEQPYASWDALSKSTLKRPRRRTPMAAALEGVGLHLTADGRWERSASAPGDWAAKVKASGAYPSQMAVLRKAPRTRILAYELLRGGERVMWCRLR